MRRLLLLLCLLLVGCAGDSVTPTVELSPTPDANPNATITALSQALGIAQATPTSVPSATNTSLPISARPTLPLDKTPYAGYSLSERTATVTVAQQLPFVYCADVAATIPTLSNDELLPYLRSLIGHWIDHWQGVVSSIGRPSRYPILVAYFADGCYTSMYIQESDYSALRKGDQVRVSGVINYIATDQPEPGFLLRIGSIEYTTAVSETASTATAEQQSPTLATPGAASSAITTPNHSPTN